MAIVSVRARAARRRLPGRASAEAPTGARGADEPCARTELGRAAGRGADPHRRIRCSWPGVRRLPRRAHLRWSAPFSSKTASRRRNLAAAGLDRARGDDARRERSRVPVHRQRRAREGAPRIAESSRRSRPAAWRVRESLLSHRPVPDCRRRQQGAASPFSPKPARRARPRAWRPRARPSRRSR